MKFLRAQMQSRYYFLTTIIHYISTINLILSISNDLLRPGLELTASRRCLHSLALYLATLTRLAI